MQNINSILEDVDKKYNKHKLNQQFELEQYYLQNSLQIKEILGQDVIIETDKVIRNAIKNGNIRKHKGSKYIIEEIFNLPINNIKHKELNRCIEKYRGYITNTIMNHLESRQDINITHLFMEGIGNIQYPTQDIFDFCINLIFPPIWPFMVYETIRYNRMRSRGYLPITLTVIFEKKESKDIAIGLPAI